ncbi:hypothetical protein R3W88_020637 [Solanum pinnatisectum]|uniref:F-box associated beta-propeller type 1 domain-containing protein n=1 Tax=Solanum pinnatisectum TaxID=50273 RepID=A0AAV9KMR0_9SOLN|nr:hypothetical protein R3W88_020637 [Solanum pinnatisectum]
MVCTSFYDIFSDPLFVLMHHTRSPFPCILFSNYHSVYSILELKSDYDYNSCPKINPIVLSNEFHLPQLTVKVTLIGLCDGFISILVGFSQRPDQFVYISNPLLGEYVELNMPKWDKRLHDVVYGFCSSQASRQYKVLRSAQYREVTELEVYTLGVDEKWRILEQGPFSHWGSFGDVIVNGALHWIKDHYASAMVSIYSFDIETEKTRAKLGDILCMSDSCKREYLDIWWMKEYGISESWVKLRISMNSIARPGLCNPIYKPIIFWNDGEILLQNNCRIEEFNSYNPKDEFLSKVIVYRGSAVVTTYILSFYSLKTVVGDTLEISKVYPKIEIV